uniref:Uncharacterized protein n=1 Tax=Lygus hesperus TaxID=30085 RepID=A0A0A9XHR0_LYGHE
MECRWLLIVCLMLLLQLSFEATSEQSTGEKNVKRQTKRRNNIGFFGLLRNFVRDTIADTNFVIRNITDIVSEEFPPPTQDGRNSTSSSGVRLPTLPEATAILGRNYRSLMRLFRTEFSTALKDSRNNVQTYKKEFRNAVRPYFTAGGFTSTTTPRSTKR